MTTTVSSSPARTPALSRRRALALGAATIALLPSLVACRTFDYDQAIRELRRQPVPPGPPFTAPPTVDIHCHIFNFKDVPAVEFAKQVFLESSVLGDVLSPLLDLVGFVMNLLTPSTEDEIEHLASPSEPFPLGGGPADDKRAAALADFLTKIDGEHGAGKPVADRAEPFPSRLQDAYNQRNDRRLSQYQRFLALMVPVDKDGNVVVRRGLPEGGAAPGAPAPAAPEALTYRDNAKGVADTVLGDDPFGGAGPDDCKAEAGIDVRNAVRWAMNLTHYRYELLTELASLLPFADEHARVFTPSLIDYDYWLKKAPEKDPTPSSVLDQLRAMEAISKMAPDGMLVHCFVPFDPLRYAWERHLKRKPDSMDIVRAAINDYGAIGAKIYPPMGYLPIGNAKLKPDEFGDTIAPEIRNAFGSELGSELDKSLDEFYRFCADPEVDAPIFTHCSNSQGSFAGAALRAGPKPWTDVLALYKGLRVNLAHAGGPWCLVTPGAKNCTDKGVSLNWFEETIAMVASDQYENLYLDVADFDLYMACEAEAKLSQVYEGFVALLDPLSAAARLRAMERMMYGTDWLLLGRAPYAETYFARMRAKLIDRLAAKYDARFTQRFFGGNALRFLGLVKPRPGERPTRTWERLARFHERHGRPGLLDGLHLQA
jgi:predicted TIM-barrel fold metal-dependent hydrolase